MTYQLITWNNFKPQLYKYTQTVFVGLLTAVLSTQATYSQPASTQSLSPIKANEPENLQQLGIESTSTSGTIFVDPEKVLVKPPVLSALISIDRRLSPFDLDASSTMEISLAEVLKAALANNLPIKISQATSNIQKWKYVASLGSFLPNIGNETTFQGFNGRYVGATGAIIPIRGPVLNLRPGFDYTLFAGGRILHTALQEHHLYRSTKYALSGTTADILAQASKLYWNLVLNDVLLQIRVKAVETSEGVLLRNEDLYANGVVTKLDVMQARTQRSRDRQALIAQQIARRQAAIALATALNMNPEVDLVIHDRLVTKVRHIDESDSVGDLLKTAIDNRPELKKYEELRLAAKEAIAVARSRYFPTVTVAGGIANSGARASNKNLSGMETSALSGSGGVSFAAPTSTAGLPLASSFGEHKTFQMRSLFLLGLDATWSLEGMGLTTQSQVLSAKSAARKAQLEFADELTRVYEQVRNTFLDSLSAENMIRETTDEVNSSEEALRLAQDRLANGVGTELDVVFAQRDCTSALVNKAQALIAFNIAQVQLLRNCGVISYDTVTSNKTFKP